MNRIVLRKGGKVARRKLRNGNDAIPFRVLRGGEVLPIGRDEVGTIGIIAGRNHDHGGVDMNFRDGQKIEAEGGELIRIPMNGEAQAEILSRRTKNGFNPTAEVESGNMTFDEAFANQEMNKKMYRRSLKRSKAAGGFNVKYSPNWNFGLHKGFTPYTGAQLLGNDYRVTVPDFTTVTSTPYSGFDTSKYYDTARRAATINTIGNVGGALLSGIGGLIGSAMLERGYRNAAAYLPKPSEMKYVDISDTLKNYKAPKAVASLAAITDQTTGQQGALERNYQTLRRSLRRDTRSAAAGQAKLATALTNYTDARSKLADTDAELRNRTALGNADALTRVSIANAQSDMNRNSDIARLTLDKEKFNADVHNNTLDQLKLGLANRETGIARAWSSGINSALAGVGNSINKSGDSWSNTINELNANQMNIDYLMYARDPSEQISYALRSNDVDFARWIYNRYKDTNPTIVAPIKSRFNFA